MEKTMAELLVQARKAKNLTQAQLASKLKIDQSAIGRYESGKFIPNQKNRSKLAKALGLDENYFELASKIKPEKEDTAAERFRMFESLPEKEQRIIMEIIEAFDKKRRWEKTSKKIKAELEGY